MSSLSPITVANGIGGKPARILNLIDLVNGPFADPLKYPRELKRVILTALLNELVLMDGSMNVAAIEQINGLLKDLS